MEESSSTEGYKKDLEKIIKSFTVTKLLQLFFKCCAEELSFQGL